MKITIDPHVKALIFDVDGTLADSMPVHLAAWQVVADKYNFVYTRENLHAFAGMSGQEIVAVINERNGKRLDPDEIAYEKERLFLDKLDEVRPIQPVVDVLERYHKLMPVAAGTGGYRNVATRILQSIGIYDRFDTLISADDVERHKPHPDTFLECAGAMGVDPADCLVFEDAELGFQAARRAGMHLIDVRPYYNGHDKYA